MKSKMDLAQSLWIGMEMDVFMKQSGSIRVVCAMVFAAIFAGELAYAGGVGLYEFGSPDVGLAGAGRASRARTSRRIGIGDVKTTVHPC
jgi:hypothetical protein